MTPTIAKCSPSPVRRERAGVRASVVACSAIVYQRLTFPPSNPAPPINRESQISI